MPSLSNRSISLFIKAVSSSEYLLDLIAIGEHLGDRLANREGDGTFAAAKPHISRVGLLPYMASLKHWLNSDGLQAVRKNIFMEALIKKI